MDLNLLYMLFLGRFGLSESVGMRPVIHVTCLLVYLVGRSPIFSFLAISVAEFSGLLMDDSFRGIVLISLW